MGDYLWQAPPFERLPLADAKRYCQERHSGLLPPSVFFQQYARHHQEMTTHGTFWTDAPPVSGDGAAVDWMLSVDDQGNARTGQTWHDPSERLLVRCARLNPNPPPPPSADTEPASCDTISVDSECMEHDQVALEALSAETRAQICEHMAHGTYQREHCPAEDQVGRCARAGGQTLHYYSTGGAPYDEARARTACGSRGDFAASSR